jgi:2-(1,2-epoxy-1,2-dihydrophenyl)acetyl-CoA isomerase
MSAVRVRIEDRIAQLTLNRPERHNALVPELLCAIRDRLAEIRDSDATVLVLEACGPSFSTGGDVAAFYDTARSNRKRYAQRVVGELNATLLDLLDMPMPTVVAVHGLVTGGSVGLVLACDIAVVGDGARFAPWYTVVGFSPDGGWTTLMPERIGRARALDIQLTNRVVDADEAYRLGLAQYRAGADDTGTRALDVARTVRDARPASVGHTLALTRPNRTTVAAGLEAEYQHFLEQIDSDEADRGMAAFLKR